MINMSLGLNKKIITPTNRIPLAGFGHRTGVYTKIAQDIYIRTVIFNNKLVLVSGDLLWWGNNIVQRIKEQLKLHDSTKDLVLLLSATHNHSGPNTSDYMSPILGKLNPEYNDFLIEQVLSSIKEACQKQKVIKYVRNYYDACDFSVHRRRHNKHGKIDMAPNYEYKYDNSIPITCFYDEFDKLALVITKMSCHPAISDENIVSGEYPGVVNDYIEHRYKDCISIILQGFSADIRPALIKNDEFYKGTFNDIKLIGTKLGQKIIKYISKKNITNTNITDKIKIIEKDIKVPIKTYSKEELLYMLKDATSVEQEWYNYLLQKYPHKTPNYTTLKLGFYNIGNILRLITLNAEVVSEYQNFINRELNSNIWGVGYCNGMISYIPTATQIQEGGYEPRDSVYYFYLNGFFSSEVESILKTEIRKITTQ